MYELEVLSLGIFFVFNIQQYCWFVEEEKVFNDVYIYFFNFVWKIIDYELVVVYIWFNFLEMWF